MEQASKYRTIESNSEGFYKEKGSKFFAFAIPCKTELDAKTIISDLRKKHHQAVHVCSAFRFGSDKKLARSSDDGEPSNSAGPPILGQIHSFDLTNILIAVVRYYGGTNLGVGGLINAYRTAAKEALTVATIIEKEDDQLIELHFDYAAVPIVMAWIKQFQLTIAQQDFNLSCSMQLIVPISEKNFALKISAHNELASANLQIKLINHGIID